MSDDTKKALANLEQIAARDPAAALEIAYQLGKFDGVLQAVFAESQRHTPGEPE